MNFFGSKHLITAEKHTKYENGLRSLHTATNKIKDVAEDLRYLRPSFYETVDFIDGSPEDGTKVHKLLSALLQEFEFHLNASLYLDKLRIKLGEWAKESSRTERIEIYRDLEADIQDFRKGKSNEVHKIREQIALLKRNLEEERAETEKLHGIEADLRLEMQRLKGGHDQIQRTLEIELDRSAKKEKRHKKEIERLSNEWEEHVARLEAKHRKAESSAQASYNKETSRLQKTIDKLNQDIDKHKDQRKNQVSKLLESHASRIQLQARKHQTKEEELLRQLSETKRNHEQVVKGLELEYESSLQEKTNYFSSTIENMNQEHEDERSKWSRDLGLEKEKCASEKLQLATEYSQNRILMEQEHTTEMMLSREMSEKEVASMRDKLETQQASFAIKIEEIEEKNQSRLGELTTEFEMIKEEHTAQLLRLRNKFEDEIEAYSAALLARDKFTPTPDEDIKAIFMTLTQDVDALSQLEWKADRKLWPAKALTQHSNNERSLKQQILQDIIWRSLQEYIFCSPFRILGEEGKILERKWNDAYGQDPRFDNGFYIWPKPEIETERWRYITVKECRTALRQPLPSEWDPRAKIKKGFKFSLETLREAVGTRIAEVAKYNEESVQATERMTIKAVNMWLEFGAQRCRVLATENRANDAVADKKVLRVVHLLVRPQLKRHGKSDGQDLDIEEVIKGCEGESISLIEV